MFSKKKENYQLHIYFTKVLSFERNNRFERNYISMNESSVLKIVFLLI